MYLAGTYDIMCTLSGHVVCLFVFVCVAVCVLSSRCLEVGRSFVCVCAVSAPLRRVNIHNVHVHVGSNIRIEVLDASRNRSPLHTSRFTYLTKTEVGEMKPRKDMKRIGSSHSTGSSSRSVLPCTALDFGDATTRGKSASGSQRCPRELEPRQG